MKTLTEYLSFHTPTHRAYVHITPQVEEIVRKSGVKEGMVLVSAMHITAGVYDNESELIEDITSGWNIWRRFAKTTNIMTRVKTTATLISKRCSYIMKS